MTTSTISHTLGDATLGELEQGLRGQLIRPGDSEYDEARAIWNGAHDQYPALIVRAAGAADVMRAVDFARSEDLVVAVRGGGHSLPGFSTTDGGIVIDLSAMNTVHVDPTARTAVAEGGALWSDFDHETQAFGLAVTGGLISTTGIGGFTLGGGIGWLMRKYGLTCDNLIGADVVTADGQLVHCSEDENPELLWGLRGGGGNFGIATSLEFRLHPVGPMVLAGPVFFAADRAEEILRFYREWIRDLPDDVTTLVNLTTAPPAPFLPEEVHGKRIVGVVAAHAGDPEAGRALVQPLKDLGDPIADLLDVMPYTTLQTLLDALWGPGAHNYFRSAFMDGIDDDAIAALVAQHGSSPSPSSEIHIQHLGGAIARVGEDDTAFGNRSAPLVLNVIARTPDAEGFAESVAWARGHRRGARAGHPRRGVRQLHGRRRRRPAAGLLRRRQVRPAGRAQAPLRPDEPVPAQPEHRAVATSGSASGSGLALVGEGPEPLVDLGEVAPQLRDLVAVEVDRLDRRGGDDVGVAQRAAQDAALADHAAGLQRRDDLVVAPDLDLPLLEGDEVLRPVLVVQDLAAFLVLPRLGERRHLVEVVRGQVGEELDRADPLR